jgi:hypothetical protein
MITIDATETAKLIRGTLKSAFSATEFNVEIKHFWNGHSTSASWIDGPSLDQVQLLLDHFNGSEFDSMTDPGPGGRHVLAGVQVKIYGGCVLGFRCISPQLEARVASELARQCGLDGPEPRAWVPFQWRRAWRDKALTMDAIEAGVLTTSHDVERFDALVSRVLVHTTLEPAQGEVPAELLPERIA